MDVFSLAQLEYFLRIVLAGVCGGIIGYERSSRLKAAGIRTHLIVAIAASLMMVVSKYGFGDVLGSNGVGLDPSRIAAGVVTAVGFLGAGVIFIRKQNVSGVTTAAGIWATVGVGLAIGGGLYLIGVATALLIVLTQLLSHKSKFSKEPISEQITLEFDDQDNIQELLSGVLEQRRIELVGVKVKKLESSMQLQLLVKYPEHYDVSDILRLLKEIPNIKSIEI